MNHVAIKKALVILSAVLLCFLVERAAAAQDPISMLKGVTDQVMKQLTANVGTYRANPSQLYSMVDSVIIPHADFEEMVRWIVGRKAWQSADEATRTAFTAELKKIVIRTYARSLLNYSNQTIEFMPLRGSAEGKGRIQVSSVINDPRQGNLRLDYRLVRSGETWKVYDIIIEGVSLMQGYRSQFQDAINNGGMKAALAQIKARGAA